MMTSPRAGSTPPNNTPANNTEQMHETYESHRKELEEKIAAEISQNNPLTPEDPTEDPTTADRIKHDNNPAVQIADAKSAESNDSTPHDFPITTRERNYWRFAAGAGAGLGLGSITVNLWLWLSGPTGAGTAGAGLTTSATVATIAITGVLGLGVAVGGYFAYKAYKDFVQQAEDLNKQINLEKAAYEKEKNKLLNQQINLIKELLILRNQCKDYAEFLSTYTPEIIYKDLKETINKSSLSPEEKTQQWNTHSTQFSKLSVLIDSKYKELKQSHPNAVIDDTVINNHVNSLSNEQLKSLTTMLPKPATLKSIQAIELEVNNSKTTKDAARLAFRNYALGSFVGIFCTTWGIAAIVTGLTLTFSIPIVGWIAGLATISVLGAYAIGRLAERYSIKNSLRKAQLDDVDEKKSQIEKMGVDTLKATGQILQKQVQLLKSPSNQQQLIDSKSPNSQSQTVAELQQRNEEMATQIAAQQKTERDLRRVIEEQNKKLAELSGNSPKVKSAEQPAHAPHSPESDATILRTLSSVTAIGSQPGSPKQGSPVREKKASNEQPIDTGIKKTQNG